MIKSSRIRRAIQLFFLTLFIFFFVQTRYHQGPAYPNIFFRFDPLILLVTGIAARTLIIASLLSVLVILGTILFGRWFCGFLCPLGTVIDVFDTFLKKTAKKAVIKSIPWFDKDFKLLVLIFLVISALLGVSFLHFFDPMVIMERSLTLFFYPVINYLVGFVFLPRQVFFTEIGAAALVFFLIVGLGFITPRCWCRTLCPLGGLLSLFSRIALFRFSFVDGCRTCGLCEKRCPTAAIDESAGRIDAGECILCLRCRDECPEQAIAYRPRPTRPSFSLGRRRFLVSLGMGVLLAPAARLFPHNRLSGRLIRPPGAIPEPDFLNACVHCARCMKICPTNGLQPCILEAGLNGIWTPRLDARIGGCEKDCHQCGQICPTSAIRRLPLEEKTFVKMGTAVIDRSRCIAWEQDKVCLICDEACPYNAISSFSETIRGTTLLRPFIDERICTGCGLCEARCPIEGAAAIQVFSIGEERCRHGTYKTEEKVRLRSGEPRPEDIPSGFILDNN